VTCLTPYIEEAQKHYNEAMAEYVKELAQHQLSSLMTFFDGVDAIYRGMKDHTEYEMIQYEDQYSKYKLSKLISKFPLSRIEKGMYREYRKLHRNLSQEEGLLNEVWQKLKDFIIQKYKRFEFLVSECYKTQSKLQFTSAELEKTLGQTEDRYEKKRERGDGVDRSEMTTQRSDSDDETTTISKMY